MGNDRVITHPDTVKGLTPKLNWILAIYCGEKVAGVGMSLGLMRRILEEPPADALYWATELDLAGFGEYVFKRLVIIASEDVGPADRYACVIVATLREAWRDQRKKKDERHAPERLFLVHAILYLAAAPKSRMVDHALIVHYEGPRERREIPDFALDLHTQRGRSRKRGHAHFWEHGAAIHPAANLDDPYAPQAREIRRDKQTDLPGFES